MNICLKLFDDFGPKSDGWILKLQHILGSSLKTVFFSNFVVRQVCLRARISFDGLRLRKLIRLKIP
jgi:hypothetical protein